MCCRVAAWTTALTFFFCCSVHGQVDIPQSMHVGKMFRENAVESHRPHRTLRLRSSAVSGCATNKARKSGKAYPSILQFAQEETITSIRSERRRCSPLLSSLNLSEESYLIAQVLLRHEGHFRVRLPPQSVPLSHVALLSGSVVWRKVRSSCLNSGVHLKWTRVAL
jgi:hypothetical protein